MGLIAQLKLSYQMTAASARMTWRYPRTLLVGLGNLLLLTLVAVGPIVGMIILWQKDADKAWWALRYVFQFWFVADAAQAGDIGSAIGLFFLWLLVIYTLWMTIVSFCTLMTTTVIMHTGVMQLRGQRPSIREGFRLAWRNVGRIAALAVFAGVFIGLTKRFTSALRAIPFVGRIARGAILSALTGLLYLALPVVVYERNGVVSSLRSTWTQLRKTWGGLVVGTGLMMSALWMGLWVVEFAVKTAFEAMTPVRVIDWSTMLILQVFAAVTLYALNVALSANLRAALYLHVTEGHTGILPEKALVGTMPAPRQTPLQVASAQVATAPRLTTFEIVRRP